MVEEAYQSHLAKLNTLFNDIRSKVSAHQDKSIDSQQEAAEEFDATMHFVKELAKSLSEEQYAPPAPPIRLREGAPRDARAPQTP